MIPFFRAGSVSSRHGITLVTVVLSCALLGLATLIFVRSVAQAKQATQDRIQTLKAELYGLELLEALQSLKEAGLKGHLSKNPVSGSTSPADLYPLCSHINLLDRSNGSVFNRDDFAAFSGDTQLAQDTTPSGTPNRFYQVHVIDMTTLQFNTALCNQAPTAVTLGPNEKFFVTVGVTWKSARAGIQRVAMSAPIL